MADPFQESEGASAPLVLPKPFNLAQVLSAARTWRRFGRRAVPIALLRGYGSQEAPHGWRARVIPQTLAAPA